MANYTVQRSKGEGLHASISHAPGTTTQSRFVSPSQRGALSFDLRKELLLFQQNLDGIEMKHLVQKVKDNKTLHGLAGEYHAKQSKFLRVLTHNEVPVTTEVASLLLQTSLGMKKCQENAAHNYEASIADLQCRLD